MRNLVAGDFFSGLDSGQNKKRTRNRAHSRLPLRPNFGIQAEMKLSVRIRFGSAEKCTRKIKLIPAYVHAYAYMHVHMHMYTYVSLITPRDWHATLR